MAYGLRTFDGNGNIIVDTNFALGRVLGWGTYNAPSGSFQDTRWSLGRPFWILTPYNTSSSFFGAPSSTLNTSNWTLSWSGGQSGTIQIVWGIF